MAYDDIGGQVTGMLEGRDAAATSGDSVTQAKNDASTIRSVAKDGLPPQAEQDLAKEIIDKIKAWKKHHKPSFKKMKEDVRFAANKHGAQWNGTKNAPMKELYVAQITFRHIQSRTGVLYAKNPRVKAQRRKRIDHKIWDGTQQQLKQAMEALDAAQKAQQAAQAQQQAALASRVGAPPPAPADPASELGNMVPLAVDVHKTLLVDPSTPPPTRMAAVKLAYEPHQLPGGGPPPVMPPSVDIQGAQAVLADAQQVKQKRLMLDRIGQTAEILYGYYQGEGDPAFKKRAKAWVRRTLTCGVGWLKLDFERKGQENYSPQDKDNVDNLTTQLNHLKSELEKVAEDETTDTSARIIEIEAQLKALQEAAYVVVKEGLTFSFPKSWRVIPDDTCSQLTGLVDCWGMAEEIPSTPDEIREAYGVDIENSNFVKYEGKDLNGRDRVEAIVYEHYDRRTGLMCVVCEGYPGFLVAPAPPRVAVSRFFPFYPLAFNEMECEDGEIFPPSDVALMEHQQREYNRAREALRQHRIASQPGHVADKAAFSNEADVRAMRDRNAHEVVMLEGLGGKPVKDVIMAIPLNTIDPNIYQVNEFFQDVQRSVGDQAADLGGPQKNATATADSISENSRMSTIASNVDDLDMVLTEVARDSCQVMLCQVSQETAAKIAGDGAMWPGITGDDYAMEIYLEIVAGSSGRPNRDRDAANIQRLFPLAIQTGEINPKYLARKVVETMDETVDLEDAILDGMPSILAMNEAAKGGAPAPSGDPAMAPGAQGGAAPAPPPSAPAAHQGGGPGPMHPAPNAGGGPPLP